MGLLSSVTGQLLFGKQKCCNRYDFYSKILPNWYLQILLNHDTVFDGEDLQQALLLFAHDKSVDIQ